MRRQFFDLRPGETLTVGDSRITLEAKTGQRARLKVESDEPTNKAAADEAPLSRPNTAPNAAPSPFLTRPTFNPG